MLVNKKSGKLPINELYTRVIIQEVSATIIIPPHDYMRSIQIECEVGCLWEYGYPFHNQSKSGMVFT